MRRTTLLILNPISQLFITIYRSIVTPIMDPVIVVMIEKLSDGNIRIREGARKGLEVLAGDVTVKSAVAVICI